MDDRLLTRTEVARMFRVNPRTILRWARDGRLREMRTPGNHARYYERDVRALVDNLKSQQENGA